MKALAYRLHELRGVLDPRTAILAGPFRALAGDMLNAGWEFQRREDMNFEDQLILARNPRNGMVARSYVSRMHLMQEQCHRIPPYLYFGENLILEMDFYRSIEMPRMSLQGVDVGHPVPLGPNEYDMEIYEANVNKEEKPQELIVLPEDIPMLMNKIIQAQEPRAKEILADQRKQEGLGELQMKAKILTFGKSA